jgi:tight adherence protein B
MTGSAPVLLAAGAGGLIALAARDALASLPGVRAWLAGSVEPLRRAGREGYAPSRPERRRLAALGAGAAVLFGWLTGGISLALPLALAGPSLAGWAVSARRSRYQRAVERSLPDIANAVADALSAGRSLRASLASAARSLDGPAAIELARVRAELELGAATTAALSALRARLRSRRVDAFAATLLSQRLAGGDLAGLMRRFAESAAERDRAEEDARAATAQARFTGLLVAAMPAGAALFAELIQPGFLSRLLASPAATVMLGLAFLLQLGGFAAIRRLARAEP